MPSADPALPDDERDDADLALYDESLNLVDAAFGIGQVEQLTVPASGVYYVRVALYSGAPLYRLSIGQSSVTAVGASLKLSDEFVPGEVVVTLRTSSATSAERQKASASLDAAFGLRRASGDATREMRMVLPGEAAAVLGRKKPQWSGVRGAGFAVPPELRSRWETLQYVKLLRTNPTVRSADPNYILRASVVPNDPYYPRSAGITNRSNCRPRGASPAAAPTWWWRSWTRGRSVTRI
jgi:serine protease